MSRTQGQPLTEKELERIVSLLEKTELSLTEIAQRMDCTRSAIAKINKDFGIRLYEGRRSYWRVVNTSPRPAHQTRVQ